jgi:glyoxylase-like metal-dependent hydrolase (beta-lactamase superfamily II)
MGFYMIKPLLAVLTLALTPLAQAEELQVIEVANDSYAIVGPLTDRSPENFGNNATFGFVVSDEGVLLIDSGGSWKGAEKIEAAIKTVTDKPVIKVINTGGQDHCWFGNDYFAQQGAELISSSTTQADQKAREAQQVMRITNLTGDAYQGTQPIYANTLLYSESAISLGSKTVQFIPVGHTHTPGENFVWLPESSVLYTGDTVFVDRMLGVAPQSQHLIWIEAFEVIESLNPKVIVPGHGAPTTVEKAKADTLNYLTFLREKIGVLIEEGGDMQRVSSIDQSAFSYLNVYEEIHGRNAQRVFEEMEWE